MSKETAEWLNTRTVIGYTDKRGNAWHYRADLQDGDGNHYAGPVPMERVRELFGFQLTRASIMALTEDGFLDDPTRVAIVRPVGALGADDKGEVLGVFSASYQEHQYAEWLVENVESLLDADLAIGSAGLLKGGRVAWSQIELEDTISTPEGVDFRPFLTAATSCDGSLATQYSTGAQVVVCDNTLAASVRERDAKRVKIRHSSRSLARKVQASRDALGLIHGTADAFAAEVAALCATTVTDRDWMKFLDVHSPLTDEMTARSRTIATNERENLTQLWSHDGRVSPWKGTGFGVLQAVNTYTHHVGTVRGTDRATRNTDRMVTGEFAKLDAVTLAELDRVLSTDLASLLV